MQTVRDFWPIAIIISCLSNFPAHAGDWPQILGPARNGIAQDEQLANRWPRGGPPLRWEKSVGRAYAGAAIVGERAFIFHRIGDEEILEALDVKTGQTLYRDATPTTFEPQVGSENGPLCVPTVAGKSVITYGAQGVLTCLDVETGKRLWQRQALKDFKAPEGYFGAGSCPLIVGDLVIVNVGGSREEAGIVAFALSTGTTVWKQTNEPASYSAPVAVEIDGETLVLIVTRYRCQLLEPKTGTILFQFPFGQRGPTVNAATPLVMKDRLLVTASYGIGMVYGEFNLMSFKPLYEDEGPVSTQYCTPIYHDGYLYCIDGREDVPPADLKCIELAALRSKTRSNDEPQRGGSSTSPVKWIEHDFGYGTLLMADGKLIAVKSSGELLLLTPSPDELRIVSKCRPFRGTVRALPALSNGRLLIRDEETLKCLDVSR